MRNFKAVLLQMTLAKRGRPLAASHTQILILPHSTHSHKPTKLGPPSGPGDKCDTQPNGLRVGSGGTGAVKPRLLLASWG